MTDIFRKEYKPLNEEQKKYIGLFKDKADELIRLFYEAAFLNPETTCMSLGIQRLQESVMWATKSITKD